MKYVAQLIASLAVSVVAGSALADNHMGVDTAAGAPGNQVLIRAGYYPAETSYTISGGRLRLDGDIAVYDVVDQLSQAGPYSGWYAGQELLLTSDFYASTGHLNGGNFMWELASITPLSGGPGIGSWGDFDALGEFTPSALTSAGTRIGRSFDTATNQHDEDQAYAFSAPGLYDLTFIAWDSNGVYTDSASVTVRFNVVPAPGAAVALGLGALVASRRRRA